MPLGRCRITEPTLALIREGGRYVAHMVPAGAFITFDGSPADGDNLVEVTWDDKRVRMFAEDLRSRAERVEGASN